MIAWAVTLMSPSVFCAQPSLEDATRAVAEERFEDARAIFRQLQRDQPTSLVFAVWIGRLSGWLEDYETAEVAYDLALRLDDHNVEALLGKDQVLLWQRNFSPARELITDAARLAPGAADVLMMRA